MLYLYAVLGVDPKASGGEIKRAYRRLAHRLHPDKNPNELGAEERFKEVTRAYQVLSHPEQRRKYDRLGPTTETAQQGSGFSQRTSDVFNEMFADFLGRTPSRKSSRGRDRRMTIELDFRTAVLGGRCAVDVPHSGRCATCSGTGARPGSVPQLCHACGGSGKVGLDQGLFPVKKTCAFCHGRGRTIADPCKSCGGRGTTDRASRVTLEIPAGTAEGALLHLPGQGEAGAAGSPAGDLEVYVKVRQDPVFSREGADLHCQVPISLAEAALGGQIEVPTLEGRVRMRIPAATQSGKVFRLRGKGAPSASGSLAGDQHVTVMVETPQNLNERDKKALAGLDQLDGASHYPERAAFWERVRAANK